MMNCHNITIGIFLFFTNGVWELSGFIFLFSVIGQYLAGLYFCFHWLVSIIFCFHWLVSIWAGLYFCFHWLVSIIFRFHWLVSICDIPATPGPRGRISWGCRSGRSCLACPPGYWRAPTVWREACYPTVPPRKIWHWKE